MPVHRHGHYHIGGGKHADNLQVLDQAAERIGPLKTLSDVPHQLGKHLYTRGLGLGLGLGLSKGLGLFTINWPYFFLF